MRRLTALVAACLVVLGSAVFAAPSVAQGVALTGGLHGTITGTDGSPLGATTMTVHDPSGRVVATVTSDADGAFAVDDLLPGRYFVCADSTASGPGAPYGYSDTCYPNETKFGVDMPSSTASVLVTSGVSTNTSMILSPAGALTGRITDKNGDPLHGFALHLTVEYDNPENTTLSAKSAPHVTVGPDGHYLATGIAPAVYAEVCVDGRAVSGGLSQTGYAQGCQLENGDFAPVAVRAGVATPMSMTLRAEGGVRGTVRAADGGAPLADVAVTVWDNTRRVVGRARTAADGRYRVSSLDDWGGVLVCFNASQSRPGSAPTGYRPECYHDHAWDGYAYPHGARRVPVRPGIWTNDVDEVLDVGASISGGVTTSDGDPVEAATVLAYRVPPLYDFAVVVRARTDATGRYHLLGLDAADEGGLVVCVRAPRSPSGHRAGLVGTCPTDYGQLASRTPITVVAGADTGGVDIQLDDGMAVAGKVTSADGLPLRGVDVVVHPAGATSMRATAMTGSAGRYFVPGLDPTKAPVSICFDPRGAVGSASVTGYKPTCTDSVGGSAGSVTTDIDVVIPDAAALAGTVRSDATGAGIPGIEVYLYGLNDEGAYQGGHTITDAEGDFTVTGLTGRSVQACFLAPRTAVDTVANTYLSECYDDQPPPSDLLYIGTPGTRSPLAAGVTTRLAVTLTSTGSIAGQVTRRADGTAVSHARVTVYDKTGQFAGESWTADDGSYAVSRLPARDPGARYRVCFAGTDVSRQCYGDVEWFRPSPAPPDAARVVTVPVAGTRSGVDAALDPGYSIDGVVVGSHGNPLSETAVTWFAADDPYPGQKTYTDENGRFTIAGLPAGSQVRLCNSVAWFETTDDFPCCYRSLAWADYGHAPAPRAALVTVTADGQKTVTIRRRGPGTGSLRGRIGDPATGAAVAGAQVYAVRSDGVHRTTTTAQDGSYVITGLVPGHYGVCVRRAGHTADAPGGYQDWCRGGAPLTRAATPYLVPPRYPLVVGTGPTSGGDVEPARGGAIAGLMHPAKHRQASPSYSYEEVSVYRGATRVATAALDGDYRVDGLAPGRYSVCFSYYDEVETGGLVGYECWHDVAWTTLAPPLDKATKVTVRTDHVITGVRPSS